MTIPTIICVLRSGGDYGPDDVKRLRTAALCQMPGARFVTLTDMSVIGESRPLQYGFPGWWSKMELFCPDHDDLGDLLYFDLDTVPVASLREIAAVNRLTLLADFYHLEQLASGVMYLPINRRHEIWRLWVHGAFDIMARYAGFNALGTRGDGAFIGDCYGASAAIWQRELPDQLVSYKIHIRDKDNNPPPGARVVCFHGEPRPSKVNAPWIKDAQRDWSGRTVLIIGGGPSAGKLALDALPVADLRKRGIITIGINRSAEELPWVDYAFTVDGIWLSERRRFLEDFSGRLIACLVPEDLPRAAGLECDLLECLDGVGLSDDPMAAYQGGNSGFAALNCALARAAARVFLAGYDMTEAGHWHGGYDWQSRFGANCYPWWVSYFDQIGHLAAGRVYNLNPQSGIRSFPFAAMEDLWSLMITGRAVMASAT